LRRTLWIVLAFQALAHWFWLSPAAHSGQVSIPWLMNRGHELFGSIWEQHAPGSSLLAAAAQRILPAMDPGLLAKLLNILLVLAVTVLVYRLALRLSGDERAGGLAALCWGWWEPVYGNVLFYFDSLLAACLLAACLVYAERGAALSPRRIIALGLLLGLGTLFKQHGWLALLLLAAWIWLDTGRWQSLALYVAAALLLPLLQCFVLGVQGLLNSYVYWNWTFNFSGLMDSVPLDGDFLRKVLLSNVFVLPYILLHLNGRRGTGAWRKLLPALLWLAGLTLLYPRVGENHAMGHLPLAAVMSGCVLAAALRAMGSWRRWDIPRKLLAGLALSIGLGWLWTGAASYLHIPLGPGSVLAYEELKPIADELRARKAPGDTLFILPQTDSSPQLHPLADMLPPGIWVKGWHWYFDAPQVLPQLLRDWQSEPPSWVVVFPQLLAAGQPGIRVLQDFVAAHYQQEATISQIFDHGPAVIYRYEPARG